MIKYCFICSAARSGSTILDILLGGHSRIASLGEFSFLGKALALHQYCSCGSQVEYCDFWTKVFERVLEERGIFLPEAPYSMEQWDSAASVVIDHRRQTLRYLLGKKVRSLWCDVRYDLMGRLNVAVPLPDRLRNSVDNALYLYDVVREAWQKNVIIDSSKNIHKALAVYERAPEQTRIIFLIRDGRGVFCSRLKSGFTALESARGWLKYNVRATNLLGKIPLSQHVVTLKYEKLATDTERVTRELANFLALGFEGGMVKPKHGKLHLVNGNNVRFQSEIRISLDERWRRDLTLQQIAYFNKKCGGLNRAFGYT